jgi:hypothetical protein
MFDMTDADGFEPESSQHDLIVLAISRREVETGQWASALERLLKITDSQSAARSLQGRLVVMFQGYDADRRSLAEIAEVRAYMRGLTSAWPFWITFLLPDPEAVGPVLSLLVDMRRLDHRGLFEADLDQAHGVVSRLVAAHREICGVLNLPAGPRIERRFLELCGELGFLI